MFYIQFHFKSTNTCAIFLDRRYTYDQNTPSTVSGFYQSKALTILTWRLYSLQHCFITKCVLETRFINEGFLSIISRLHQRVTFILHQRVFITGRIIHVFSFLSARLQVMLPNQNLHSIYMRIMFNIPKNAS